MNPTIPPVPPDALPASRLSPEPPLNLPRLLLGLALAVAIFDVCFWNIDSTPGFSIAVFSAALAGIILGNRKGRWEKRTIVVIALLAGACFAATVETGLTNSIVLILLIVALAGETYFVHVISPWGRWISEWISLTFFAPLRVFWLGARVMEATFEGGLGCSGRLIGGCLLIIPALVLALIFGSLLATGNAVFGSWTNSFFDWFWKELALCFNPARIVTWLFVVFLILPLLRPAPIPVQMWKWVEDVPRVPEILPTQAAFFSSGMILLVLNLLFLVANVADALFLWSGQALPAGVTYKAYVHEGVNSLIATVILSAVVLTTIFQQSLQVVKRPGLKMGAYLWVVQNVFLIFTVTEKLRRYIVFSEMTVARLSTIIFLILVSVGFILLTIKIARDRSISWLIGGCVLAIFATFYVTQFLNLGGWSADYNVARMEQDRAHGYDAKTMSQWGAETWPALRRAHDLAPDQADISTAWDQARKSQDYTEGAGLTMKHWREFSLRAWLNRSALEEKPNN